MITSRVKASYYLPPKWLPDLGSGPLTLSLTELSLLGYLRTVRLHLLRFWLTPINRPFLFPVEIILTFSDVMVRLWITENELVRCLMLFTMPHFVLIFLNSKFSRASFSFVCKRNLWVLLTLSQSYQGVASKERTNCMLLMVIPWLILRNRLSDSTVT